MRLIDADELKKALNSGGGESVDINISKDMPLWKIVDTIIQAYRKCLFAELEKMPTAYDVDKVCRKINEDKEIDNLIDADHAIKIVKAGMKEKIKLRG